MRRIGFYITDFAGYEGFTVSDFDELVARGAVKIEGRDDDSARGYLDAGDNADWAKQTLDLFIPDGDGGLRQVRNTTDLREYLRMRGMTAEEFKRLPVYRLALRKQPWLREL